MRNKASVLRLALASLSLVAAVLLITGCGESSTTDGGAGGGGEGTGGGSVETTEAPATAVLAFNQPISTLDPDHAIAQADINTIHTTSEGLYESLFGKVVPGLAESYKLSNGGKTATFTLRSGLKFSNGEPLSSADVVASFERFLNDKTDITAGPLTTIESVEGPDPTTVVINLEHPLPSLLPLLASYTAGVYPKAGLEEGKKFFNAPVSAAPYMLKSWGGSDTARLVVNPNYWGAKPEIANLEFKTVEDFNTRLTQLERGALQFALDMPPSSQAALDGADGVRSEVVEFYGWAALAMWNKTPPLNDVNLRKAISAAIDRNQINEVVWSGNLEPLAGFWPRTMKGYDSSISTEADLAEAEKLVAKTSCANGCSLKMVYTPTVPEYAEQLAVLIQSDLKKIGIDLELVRLGYAEWNGELFEGGYDIAMAGLYESGNLPDALASDALASNGSLNAYFTGYSSNEMNKLVEQLSENGGAKRNELETQVGELYEKDEPFPVIMPWAYLSASTLPEDLIAMSADGYVNIKRAGS